MLKNLNHFEEFTVSDEDKQWLEAHASDEVATLPAHRAHLQDEAARKSQIRPPLFKLRSAGHGPAPAARPRDCHRSPCAFQKESCSRIGQSVCMLPEASLASAREKKSLRCTIAAW